MNLINTRIQINYAVKEILQDAKKSTEAPLAFYDRFEPAGVIIYNDIYLEVEVLGVSSNSPKMISHTPKRRCLMISLTWLDSRFRTQRKMAEYLILSRTASGCPFR